MQSISDGAITAGDSYTIYDVGDYTVSVEDTSMFPPGIVNRDDPTLPNVIITYTGADTSAGGLLGTLSASWP